MTKSLVIHGDGYDQSLPLAEREIERAKDKIDEIVDRCLEKDNPDEAFEYGRELIKTVQLQGVELAHLIYRLHQNWEKWGLGDNLKDRIVIEWGLHTKTVDKYLNIEQEVLENQDIPRQVRDVLSEKSMDFLYKLVRPARDGSLKEEEWEELSMLPDETSAAQYINDKIGKSPRGRPPEFTISLYRDGSLVAFGKHGERTNLGILRSTDEDLENPLRRKAIGRIVKNSGILKQ